jgi:peroxiredoxin
VKITTTPLIIFAFWTTACLSGAAFAKESRFNEVISVGEKAPNFSQLPGIDGKQHSLDEYHEAKAVVLVFTSNQCPVAVAYEDRLKSLQNEYGERGVQLIAICANFEAGHDLDALKEHAANNKFNFPFLRDDSQETARAYGATHTPQAFLLDGDRNIAYMGAIDDSEEPKQVSHRYLQEAIESVLAGQQPATKETKPFGCRIRIKRTASRTQP